MLAEGSPQWSFYRRHLSHIPQVQQLHIPAVKPCACEEFLTHVGNARSATAHAEAVFDLRVQQSEGGGGGGGRGGKGADT